MIIGNFYFKQTDSGNLIGEYTNHGIDYVITESSNVVTKENTSFIGHYLTSWINEDVFMNRLEITKSSNNKYKLCWYSNDRIGFIGNGFIMDGVLIGSYTDDIKMS